MAKTLKTTRIGPNERTGMRTSYLVRLIESYDYDKGKFYYVSILTKKNGLAVASQFAVNNFLGKSIYGYKKKSEALKFYKYVVHRIKSSGSKDFFEQKGAIKIKN